jgi:hypothetical protein
LSVPNQWSALGEARVAAVSTACGLRTSQRQPSAETTQKIRISIPTRNVFDVRSAAKSSARRCRRRRRTSTWAAAPSGNSPATLGSSTALTSPA